jgi:hypothetical protein
MCKMFNLLLPRVLTRITEHWYVDHTEFRTIACPKISITRFGDVAKLQQDMNLNACWAARTLGSVVSK